MAGDIKTASGTRVFIGASITADQADTLAEFEAMSNWVEIGLIESLGEFGDQSNEVTFSALGDARVRRSKGARDAGTMTLTCGHDPTDLGQAAVEAAEQTNFNFAWRVDLPDAPAAGYSNTQIYFRGLVMGRRKNVGTNDNVIRNNYSVGINSQLFTDQATL